MIVMLSRESSRVGDHVLVLAISKTHKMAINQVGPRTITAVISDANYALDLPEKCNKIIIYHVNLLKSYYECPEFVNLVVEINSEEVEEDAEIPYPLCNPTQLDFINTV